MGRRRGGGLDLAAEKGAVSELVVVVGPTAAGKSTLGAELAAAIGGEVVSADSFAVYRGLDIGTAKPPPDVRALAPHHLIDIVEPHESYSAGRFTRDADAAIAAIAARGRRAVVVGGTHFYVRALLRGLFPEPARDPALRRRLEARWLEDPAALRGELARLDPEAARRIPAADRQRTLRALEVTLAAGRPMSELWREQRRGARYRFRMLGLQPPRTELHARIELRVKAMFDAGLLDEVRQLLGSGVPKHCHALKAIGYRECCRALDGEWTEPQAREATVVATCQLAKRQRTWLRGEPDVEWLAWPAAARDVVARLEASGGTDPRS